MVRGDTLLTHVFAFIGVEVLFNEFSRGVIVTLLDNKRYKNTVVHVRLEYRKINVIIIFITRVCLKIA